MLFSKVIYKCKLAPFFGQLMVAEGAKSLLIIIKYQILKVIK